MVLSYFVTQCCFWHGHDILRSAIAYKSHEYFFAPLPASPIRQQQPLDNTNTHHISMPAIYSLPCAMLDAANEKYLSSSLDTLRLNTGAYIIHAIKRGEYDEYYRIEAIGIRHYLPMTRQICVNADNAQARSAVTYCNTSANSRMILAIHSSSGHHHISISQHFSLAANSSVIVIAATAAISCQA